ncbi:hypothetical protein FXO37_16289 [Capsicum annuum]|nr:hypothetical protein FXO37_16289 [Capsicum annuum]
MNNSFSHQPNTKVNQSQTYNIVVPPIIPSQAFYSHTSLLHVNESQPNLRINQPHPTIIKSPPQSNRSQPTNQDSEPLMSTPANRTPVTSPNIVDNIANDNQIWIVPKGDGFDPNKVVIDGIANCIRSQFELARPSWKKFQESTREMWFKEFKEANGKDPYISELYFRTHRKKSDESWINEKAEDTYSKFVIGSPV